MPDDYPHLVARLVAIRETLGQEQGEVHAWYAAQLAAAAEAVAAAEAAVAQAEQEVADAEEAVARVDYAARRLWGDLANRLSRRAAARRGPVPSPVPDAVDQDEPPDRLISQVRARLAAAPVVQVLPSWAYPVIVLAAAGCAAAVARVALTLTGPPWARIALLALAPLLGLVPARLVAGTQDTRLDFWSVALAVGAGGLTMGVLLLLHG